MSRLICLTICFLLLQGLALRAQESAIDLRGSVDDQAASDERAAGARTTDPTNELQRRNSVYELQNRDSVVGLRSTLNAAAAETGSTGLGTAGRVTPIRAFSDRLSAAQEIAAGQGGSLDTTVFDGETTYDEAQGIRLGSFTITPELTVTGGWTDNAAGSSTGTSSRQYRIAPGIKGTSNWSRHQLDFALRGSYVGYPEQPSQSDPSLTASTTFKADLSASTTATAGVAYTFSREEASSVENISGDTNVHELTGTLGFTRNVGLVSATLGADVDRTSYATGGGSSSTSGRDNTLYSASLRVEGRGGAIFEPFAVGSLLLRRFDNTCSDAICENRDANGYELRGGLTIAATPKLTGEISGGWRIEDIKDNRLAALQGVVVDGTLVWSPSRLTTVTAGLSTSFSPTDLDYVSGSIIYSGDLRAAHSFSDRFVGEAGVGYSYRTYQGDSIQTNTLTGFVGMTYAVTRNIAFKTQYNYTTYDSNTAGSDYTKNSIEAGFRFRH
ncbi:outer membrane beta-barrel protein [Roseibium aggregatum]|uniref:Outer membrane beta-barrel protein n=1 Tax=Roseibium aggregatum TaxID=187304 RepID=A0A926P2M5_9HYPH|nr:outer membrane beta-barrel protein [Roseibium aggregatum]MBD1548420.1 outer membrane beta-barrel protein [Roseibium aggregatum]